MYSRTEFTKPFWLAGETCQLFASCGPSDDYLEMSLPDGTGRDRTVREALLAASSEGPDRSLDVRFYDETPARVGVLALYFNTAEQREGSHHERLVALLSELARALPAADFGDLLPAPIHREDHGGAVAAPATPPSETLLAQPSATGSVLPAASDRPGAKNEESGEAGALKDADPEPLAARGARQLDPLPRIPITTSLQRAREEAALGRIHKALRLLDDVIRVAPMQAEAVQLREELRLLERREKRRQRDPRNAQAQLEVGFSYLMLGRQSEAVDALGRARRISPNLYLAHLLLGVAHHREGRVAAAQSAYEGARRLQPNDQVLQDLMAALLRGEPPIPMIESGPARGSSQIRAPRQREAIAG